MEEEVQGPPEARAVSSGLRLGPEVEEAEVAVTEEASEATEEAVEASETEDGEDSGAADATNSKAFVCHICNFNVFTMNDYEDLRDDVKCNVTISETLLCPGDTFLRSSCRNCCKTLTKLKCLLSESPSRCCTRPRATSSLWRLQPER